MEDIYLHQRRNNRGCLRLLIMLAIALALLGALLYGIRSCRNKKADREFEQELEQEAPAITPTTLSEQPKPGKTPPAATRKPEPPPLFDASQPDPGPDLLKDAERLFKEGDYTSLREVGFRILDTSADKAARARAEELLGKAHIKMLFSPYPMPEKVDYTVQRGNTLEVMARRHGTTIELIQRGNNIRGHIIRVDDRYRIFTGKFSLVVDKTANDLVVNMNDRFFKRYRVGTGEYAKTPTGDFKITERIAQPIWWRPDGKRVPFGDPENLLGTHWLALDIRGYGLHGTWEPDTIGRQASAGCVRMLNEDIEELYIMLPTGTPVTIHD